MRALSFAPVIAVALVVVQYVVPGRAVFHYGWFNLILLAAVVISVYWWRAIAKRFPSHAAPAAIALLGVCAVGAAGVANGLFAPDDQTAIGAPGTSLAAPELGGRLVFPLADPSWPLRDPVVQLQRGGSTLAIPPRGRRVAGAFLLSQVPRSVVAVDARDLHGAHLTITQPTGATFLSPVLTLAQTQTIRPGLTVPFDSFAVPAAHRLFTVAFFDPAQAETFSRVDANGRALVLFAAEDEEGHSLPNGLRYALDGDTVTVAGVRLRPIVLTYPAVDVVAIPIPLVVAIGFALIVASGFWSFSLRPRGT